MEEQIPQETTAHTPQNQSHPPRQQASATENHPPFVGQNRAVLHVRGVSLWYGQVIALNDVSIDIGQGVIGLLGPNGAGKSTFLKCLTGQLKPRTGHVLIHGMPVLENPDMYSRIGLVPEQDAFYEDLTGHQFVTYLTRLQGFSKKRASELADEAINEMMLQDKRDIKIKEYSKGMRQRIKIAQALAHKPEILFLDEPLAGTDPVGRRHIIDMIEKFGSQGRTVIVSSHVLHEVEQMTTDIILINKGRILADGNIFQIREMIDQHPHSIFVGCDKPRRFAQMLIEHEDVLHIAFKEGGFLMSTNNPDACYTRIPQLALENDINLHRMLSPDNNLEAVFKYLTE